MSFVFTKQQHTSKINVWYGGIYLGELSILTKERKDIDWQKYRADKTLKMTPSERYDVRYVPTVKIAGSMACSLAGCTSREEAANKMLEYHRSQIDGK
tara:strand:- start:524 stop:817 length:294 start_codon:yes stop_codon:yes gene_type:complete